MAFEDVEQVWMDQLDKLRNVVRQELITRQLAPYATDGCSVLDVGCGQGTQALRLAARGCRVTGVDRSADLLRRFRADAQAAGHRVELHEGTLAELDQLVGQRTFDLVCLHGVLMYLSDTSGALAALARRLAPGAHLSITFRNAHGLAFRPAMRQDWKAALEAFDRREYVNSLGVEARAHDLDEVGAWLRDLDLSVVEWFGVRVFTDPVAPGTFVPPPEELRHLMDAEDLAARRDPYRYLASQVHLIATRRASPGSGTQ